MHVERCIVKSRERLARALRTLLAGLENSKSLLRNLSRPANNNLASSMRVSTVLSTKKAKAAIRFASYDATCVFSLVSILLLGTIIFRKASGEWHKVRYEC